MSPVLLGTRPGGRDALAARARRTSLSSLICFSGPGRTSGAHIARLPPRAPARLTPLARATGQGRVVAPSKPFIPSGPGRFLEGGGGAGESASPPPVRHRGGQGHAA